MRLPDFISRAIRAFRANRLRTGIGISSIRESVWHGILRAWETHRFAQLTRLAMPTCRASRVKIRPAPILGVDARQSRVLRAGSPIPGRDFPAEIRFRTQ